MLCACGDTQEECAKYCKVECVHQNNPKYYGMMKDYAGNITPLKNVAPTPQYYCPKNQERHDPFAMKPAQKAIIACSVIWSVTTVILLTGWIIIYRKHKEFTFQFNPDYPRIRCKEKKKKRETTLDRILKEKEHHHDEEKAEKKDRLTGDDKKD